MLGAGRAGPLGAGRAGPLGRAWAGRSGGPGRWVRLDDLVEPAVGVGLAAELDAKQFLPQPHGDLAGLAVADLPATAVALDRAHRGDHRGRAAGAHLADRSGRAVLAPLL